MLRAWAPLGYGAALLLVLVGCSGQPDTPDQTGASASVDSSGAAHASGEVECIRLDYPCDLGDTPPELIERTTELMTLAGERVAAGGMAAALAFLVGEPDVVEAFGSDVAIRFRVAGAGPAWLLDHSDDGPDGSVGSPLHPRVPAADPPRIRLASVVGEDTSGDGRVSNRDAKRALVLAPYHWQFSPWDHSEVVAATLERLPGYEEVRLHINRAPADQEVTIEDWLEFDQYDAIFITTHGQRACGIAQDGREVCLTVVSTGVRVNRVDVGNSNFFAFTPIGLYRDEATQIDFELGVSAGFFTDRYPQGLDDVFISLSACETGLVPGDELAAAISPEGDDLVLMAWTESVRSDDALKAAGFMLEQLSLGLSSQLAYQAVIEAGLASAFNKQGVTALEHISPGDDAVRIIELPTIMSDGEPMTDGMVLGGVTGIAGDDVDDSVVLDLRIVGVHDPKLYKVRYEFNEQPTVDAYGLLPDSFGVRAIQEGDVPYSYDVTHVIDLGMDLPIGEVELAAIVELPEGGTSRYDVIVQAPLAGAVISIGDQTWTFALHVTSYSGIGEACLVGDSGILVAGYVDDPFDGVRFSADLLRDGRGEITVHEGRGSDPEWYANADRAHIAELHLVPEGHSQIDSMEFAGFTVSGTATFIDTRAFHRALTTNEAYPSPRTGTFEIRCPGAVTIEEP